ncbi:peptidylprolyl isomerase SurA [Thalassotalea agarivorans]|uniref:Chaperone SurA n=1 Tax=Thalassotalea agarivorans TaxID=349064 RepID=A0A1I0FWF5_THASX|nr:peptidylprolyl isomerase SurA [Thalassotalea agarivorans]SET61913.1 periplasmic chaperone for outer membrane proteins SurA [Thalassotalea agarivorans]
MKKSLKLITLATTLYVSLLSLAQAKLEEIDRVAAIVNSGVVLESEVQDLVNNIKLQAQKDNQALPSDRVLRTQVVDKLINDSLMTQLGERMGVKVSDAQLDETLTNMARESGMTLEQMQVSINDSGANYETYRESVRTELIAGEVRRASVRRRIYISPQEVDNLIEAMKEQSANSEEYRLGHILIEFPAKATQEDMNNAKVRADKTIELLNKGSDFAKIAITASSDANALNGGDMGWKAITELPSLFSEVIEGKDKGEIIGPIRTGLGYSIIKILDIRGRQITEIEEVDSRHILIKPSIILSEAKAEQTLIDIREKIVSGEATFGEMAKEHSEGPTGVKGGELGWAEPSNYDPAFSEALAKLQIGEVSQPFRSSFGWHIAELTGRRNIDATTQMNTNRAYQMIFNRKFGIESARWLKETRDEAYIEIYDVEE